MSFSQHGTYHIKRQGNIIIVDAKGPYNDELLKAYKADLSREIIEVCAEFSSWSQVTVMYGDSIMTPEAEQELVELNIFKRTRGFEKNAIVFIDVEGRRIVEAQLKRVHEKAKVDVNFFSERGSAMEWLKQ